jgi:ABC-type branched-subunit amino acid transport system substrate-binding protein
MRRTIKKGVGLSIIGVLLTFVITGCKEAKAVWSPFASDQDINIAILGEDKYYDSDKGFRKGIDMAVADIKANTGININVKFYDDDGDYEKGVKNTQSVAADESITFVLTLQDFEVIDSAAQICNNAEKPLIVLQGCYDATSEKGYDYLITDCISAKQTGAFLGEYAVRQGIADLAACHTDTRFEKDEIKGMQAYLKQTDISRLVDIQLGPFTSDDFNRAYEIWDALGVDAIMLNFYEDSLYGDVIKQLCQKNPDMIMLADYGINDEKLIKDYQAYMDNIVMVPLYPYSQSEELNKFCTRFDEKYGFTATDGAVQIYDLLNMISTFSSDSAFESSLDFMKKMKSESGYEGVSGIIRFDDKGMLIINKAQYMLFSNGEFVAADKN